MRPRLPFLVRLTALLLASGSLCGADSAANRDYFRPVPEQVFAGVPFDMPPVPVPRIPDRSVSIADFGGR